MDTSVKLVERSTVRAYKATIEQRPKTEPRPVRLARAHAILSRREPRIRGVLRDLQIGDEFQSPGRTVTEADIVIFAGLERRLQRAPYDAEHMKASVFGERIAHGCWGLSIQQGLLARTMPDLEGERFVALKCKFRGPIKIGDTLHVRGRIASEGGRRGRLGHRRHGTANHEPARRLSRRRTTEQWCAASR
jgi:acyl dehydratase